MAQHTAEAIPELTLGWRLRMALNYGGITSGNMAEMLGVDPATTSRWMNDKTVPKRGLIAQWALATGVNRHWLETGKSPANPEDDGAVARLEGFEPPTFCYGVRRAEPAAKLVQFPGPAYPISTDLKAG